jgi:putative two-component system response regulator
MTNRPNKILVVDDEPLNRELMESQLIALGHEVVTANHGEDALQKVQKSLPDVILLDVMMPKMDGFEVARRLKAQENTRHIPIVMVTALKEVEDRIKALEAGANDFMSKPIDKAELRATVASQIQIKAYHDHMRQYQKELENEVDVRTEQLRRAFEKIKMGSVDTINRLSRAAEFKDEDTGAHIFRMSNYSATIARKMGFSKTVTEGILYAAPMHDVGKIGIPDRILLKPGKLNPEEWGVMRQHTQWGGAILEGNSKGFVKLAQIIALTHHEKWDGSGYPNGLKGKKIPLIGRIVAISDVFDALTSKRPYKEPFSLEKSYAIIKEGCGSHFDPKVVDAFFEAESEILVIREQYKDKGVSLFFQIAQSGLK